MNYIGDALKLTLDELSHVHKYNMLIYENIKPYLGERILEIGAGIGNISKLLIKSQPSLLVLTDFDEYYLEILSKKYNGDPKIKVHKLDISKESFMHNYQIDTIVSINVLEHIKEDIKALINCNKILCDSGKLILFLPANRFLYGELDKSLGHYRRYSKKEIVMKLREAGFRIDKIKYFNGIGILGWLINSKILKRKKIPTFHLRVFELITYVVALERYIRLPFGLSFIVVAHK